MLFNKSKTELFYEAEGKSALSENAPFTGKQ